MRWHTLSMAIAIALVVTSGTLAQETAPSVEERLDRLERIVEKLVAENERLHSENVELRTQQEVTDEKIDLVADTAQVAAPEEKLHLGGYGELHYSNLDSKEEIDFHRFVTYLGYDFSDDTRFFSELEVEHSIAGEGKAGEIEVEQAYIEHDLHDNASAKFGLFLVPVGILNETHEPPTFYGVERNPVEKDILPATWWEGGVAYTHRFSAGWSWDLALTSGLNTPLEGGSAFKIRNGRQKVGEASADSLALTSRLKWTAIPGIEVAGTFQYQDDLTQGALGVDATLFEVHAAIEKGPFGLRALYARWDLSGPGPEAIGRDIQKGFYVEPSYEIGEKLGLFARYSEWDNNAGSSADTSQEQIDLGISYWLRPGVVLKADYSDQGGAADDSGFNLGIGYSFP